MSLLLTLAVTSAIAAPSSLDLVPRGSAAKELSTTVATKGAAITTAEFAAAILDCEHYPMTATIMGVKALEECRTLDRRADGYVVVYQRTGGNALVGSRQYVIALHTAENTDTRMKIEWDLVRHTVADGQFSGPYAAAMQAHPTAVYTPYNTGAWTYDRAAGTIHYRVQSDPGGSVPGWLVSQSAVMAFPLELLKSRWGVVP